MGDGVNPLSIFCELFTIQQKEIFEEIHSRLVVKDDFKRRKDRKIVKSLSFLVGEKVLSDYITSLL